MKRINEVIHNLLEKGESAEIDPKACCLFRAKTGGVKFIFNGEHIAGDRINHQAVFFENTNYPLIVKGKKGISIKKIHLFIADHRVSETRDKGHILCDDGELYGTLNFGNQVGETDFKFIYSKADSNEQFELSFETEVLSYKLDYRSDFISIICDVEREYAMLSYSFMKDTYLHFRNGRNTCTDLIWWQIFKSKYKEIFEYASVIIDRPNRRLRSVPKYERAERMAFIPKELENEYFLHRNDSSYQYRTEELILSHDTIENRFLKYALKEMAARFVTVRQHIIKVMRLNSEQELSADINRIDNELLRLNNHPFFRGVGVFKGFTQDNIVMKQAYGYKEIMQCWIELQCGYELEDGMRKLEVKDISELYEIWCFIKVKNIVQEILGQRAKAKTSGREVKREFISKLLWGTASEVDFIKEGNITLASLQYNSTVKKEIDKEKSDFTGIASLTTEQRPDIVLRLSKEGDEIKYTYLFDAKYRIADPQKGQKHDVPPSDAIDQLHRYRDAIYYTKDGVDRDHLRKEIVAGYVLFPGRIPPEALDADDGDYYYVESNNKIGIGAFPLRPDVSEKALKELIRKWIDEEDGRQMLIEMSIPQRGLQYVDEEGGRGPYFLSTIDAQVNGGTEIIAHGQSSVFISGYNTIYAGIDFQKIRYFAPVVNHQVCGYYKVDGFSVIDASNILQEERKKKGSKTYKGYDKPFRIQLLISSYTALQKPFVYGLDRNAARGTALTTKEFKDYQNRSQKQNE